MKKIFLLSVLAGIAITSMSQGPAQFGIFAGPQMTASKYTISGNKQPNTYKYGFHAGVGWKIPFENNLYFAPEAFYSLKGYKVILNQQSFPPDANAVDNNTTLHTFELAFLLQCNFGKQPNHFFLKGGPSLDFQLFGKEKFNLINNTTINRDMRFTFGDYGRYAASMLLHLGYETANGFVLSGRYTHGMGSINNADNGPRIRHRAFGLSIGKYFTKKGNNNR